MRELDPEFQRAGIAVRFVTIAAQAEAAAFCGRFGDPARCLADPHKRTYRDMGFENFGWLGFLRDPELKRRRKENQAAGFRQDWKATKLGNAAQLPGAALIDSSGEIRWLHRGKHPGDLPPMREMLAIAVAQLAQAHG
ncbi:MAG TPA: peroxiredoxin-like family protein [Verrucomicrobiae bacterium]|nr:peroxiredoxin-like family protein [Verrucomicrobiae bacterium]